MARITLLVCLCFLVACNQSEKKSQEKAKTEKVSSPGETINESDWTILFDGSSLDNWRGYLSEDIYPEWTIEDDGDGIYSR